MIFGGNFVLLVVLLLAGFGKSLFSLFVILILVMLSVGLVLGLNGSGLLSLVFLLVYISGMLVLLLYVFCLFSKSFSFMSYGSKMWMMIMGGGLLVIKSFSMEWKGVGENLGKFMDSENLFLGCFFISFFFFSLWLVFKMLCLKKGCLRPFF